MPEDKTLQIVRNFNQNWKGEIDILNRDVMQSFSNFKCGTRLMQAALTELLESYASFYNAVAKLNLPRVRPELINVQKLMVEVKDKRPQF